MLYTKSSQPNVIVIYMEITIVFLYENFICDELRVIVPIEMKRFTVTIRRKDCEFGFEEETIEAFKEGLQSLVTLVDQFSKPVAGSLSGSKRGGGRRPPFVKNAILDLLKKEPEWMVEKFDESVAEKLRTEYGVVGAKTESVNVALLRLFSNGQLTRKEINGKYAYSVLKVP